MHWHMINTLSNVYCEISLVVKAPHRTSAKGTHAICALTTRDISQYTSDNIILLPVVVRVAGVLVVTGIAAWISNKMKGNQ